MNRLKRSLPTFVFLMFLNLPTSAQVRVVYVSQATNPAPDRREAVEEIVHSLPPANEFVEGDTERRYLMFAVVRELNRRGDCCWGALLKQDQGGKVPADIIVWQPTMEHFDILTGGNPAGPGWDIKGVVTNRKWVWAAVPGDEPTPIPTPPSSPDLKEMGEKLDAIHSILSALTLKVRDLEEAGLLTAGNVVNLETAILRIQSNMTAPHPPLKGKVLGFPITLREER